MSLANGVMNLGGVKAHPEEINAVIKRCPVVRMSRVAACNPLTGSLVAAEVRAGAASNRVDERDTLKNQILETCPNAWGPCRVPAATRFVTSLNTTASGKLASS
jgi:acyl-coenzyme A synthetase/AMP-(fatty) acid ligase